MNAITLALIGALAGSVAYLHSTEDKEGPSVVADLPPAGCKWVRVNYAGYRNGRPERYQYEVLECDI